MSKVMILIASFLLLKSTARADEYTLHTFRKIQLSDKFWAEAAAIGDINRDGHIDVVSGPYWYEGPDFKKRHEYYPTTRTFKVKRPDGMEETIEGRPGALSLGEPTGEGDSIFTKVIDMNGDGWPDILSVEMLAPESPRKIVWYENPGASRGKGSSLWVKHIVADAVDNQSVTFVDLFGDGQPVMLGMSGGQSGSAGGQVGYFKPDSKDPNRLWKFHPISWKVDEFQWYTHGLGYGDVNGDGRIDVLHSDGWWEQPISVVNDPVWRYHQYPFNLGPGQIKQEAYRHDDDPLRVALISDVTPDGVPHPVTIYGGSQMYVDDVNGDGLPDVVTSLAAHGYGLVWWEQYRDQGSSEPQFHRHIIINKEPGDSKYGVKFTEMQALAWADIDGDGLNDIVTGKRFWSHGKDGDPESNAAAVLYWFRQVRHPDKSVEFTPYLIDSDSGAGTQITVGDVNDDGLPDIVVANKKGTFVFIQEVRRVNEKEWQQAQPPIMYPNVK